MSDLTTMPDPDLATLHSNVETERARRTTVATAPDRLEVMARDALTAGVDPETIRAAVERGLTT